jgi:hypothetical protein
MGWRRRLGATGVLVGATLAIAASPASAAVYQGKIKGTPGSSFELEVRFLGGHKKVTEIGYGGVPITCDDGPSVLTGNVVFDPPERVKGDLFEARYDTTGTHIRLAGELKPGGKAVGTFRSNVDFGGTTGVCRTGTADWVAQK